MLEVGMRVRNVRRPDVIGVVVSLDAPNNKWAVRTQDHRVLVKYPRLTRLSNGKWKGGILDELPADILPKEEKIHEAFAKYKRSGEDGVVKNPLTYQRKRRSR